MDYGGCGVQIDVVKGIDDRERSYDDTQERRELEKTADMLFSRN